MRRLLTALALVGVIAVAAVPAEAGTRDGHKHKRAGIRGVVVNGTCLGPCTEPKPIHPAYAEPVTITVRRASNGVQVARRETSNGKFRMRVKRGLYDVSAIPPGPPPCIPTPTSVCPAQGADSSKQVIVPCLMGETKRVRVKRHRVTYVELHMRNVCIV